MADPRLTPHHALTYPIPGHLPRPVPRPTLPPHPITLSVSTSTAASQLDPNEQTARPGNAHQHRLFLDGLSAATTADADEPDPAATPVDPRMSAAPLSRPLTNQEEERLGHLDRLKFFFATAPSQWPGGRSPGEPGGVGSSSGWGMTGDGPTHGMHPSLNRFLLPTQEFVTCVFWNGLYHITGTDIVRALVFRFEAFGRPVHNMKKFEEGVFSDLRNLKPGVDASLEEPKSPFLDLLFKYQCIRTQKKQKVFYWFSVPHDRLFLDALDRDLKREKMGHPPTTRVISEPALSFQYDPKRSLYDQFAKQSTPNDSESDQDADLSESDSESLVGATGINNLHIDPEDSEMSDSEHLQQVSHKSHSSSRSRSRNNNNNNNTASFFSSIFGIFEGSPSYKQRRKKGHAHSSLSRSVSRSSSASVDDLADRGRPRSIVSVGSGHHHHHQPNASLSRERSQPYPSPYIHRQHSLPHFPPQDTASQYDEFPPDAATLFQQQANRITRKSLPDVNVMMAQGFTAQQQPSSQPSAPFSTDDPTFGFDIFPVVPSHSSPSLQYDIDDKNRAHTCPLVSCNKLFKRMEHLKRHLRTHTLERPYMCPICRKHFSRRDNLNQHIKTHERNDATTPVAVRALKGGVAQEMGDLDDPIGKIGMGPEVNTLGALNPAAMGIWREGSEDSDLSGAESEGFGDDRIGFFFDSQHQQQHLMGASMSNTATTAADSMFAGIGISNVGEAPGMSGLSDMQMCQMEIQPDEIQRGIEERMLQPHAHALQYATVGPNFAQDSTLWAQPSPAFPSPSGSGQQQHVRHVNRASMTGSPVGLIARHTHSGSSSVSSLSAFVNGTGSGDEYGTSTSVPLFERSGMYSPGVVDSGNASSMGVAALAGSTRRPRSMTPSLVGGGGESGIGRPMSTVSSSHGSGVNGNGSRSESGSESCSPVPMISSMNVAGGQRVYHHHHHQQHRPYANSGSGGGSTHSSPAVYSVSLGNVQAGGDSVQQHQQQVQQSQQLQEEDEMQGGLRRSESRTSFSSEQKMFGISQHRMTTAYHHHHHHQHHHHQHHQSQQPLTESPVPYTIELPQQPQQQQQHWNSHHGDVMSMVGIYDPSQQQ